MFTPKQVIYPYNIVGLIVVLLYLPSTLVGILYHLTPGSNSPFQQSGFNHMSNMTSPFHLLFHSLQAMSLDI